VHLGNAKATPQQVPGSAQTQNDRTTWDEMDAVSDRIALIFAGDQPFEILASTSTIIPVPVGTKAERLAALAAFKGRRDDLGTTHHDAGTMRMGDDVADAVTNDFGRIHDTTNCYVAGPALFPTVGSPNPMLTGVALGRRTADLLNTGVLPGPDQIVTPQSDAGFRPLFDGRAGTFKNWRLAGVPGLGGMLHVNGEMVSYGEGGLRLFYYATELFGDFTLRLQFRIFDANAHNSGCSTFRRRVLSRSRANAARPAPSPMSVNMRCATRGSWSRIASSPARPATTRTGRNDTRPLACTAFYWRLRRPSSSERRPQQRRCCWET
jgi:GMC oxidoreductase